MNRFTTDRMRAAMSHSLRNVVFTIGIAVAGSLAAMAEQGGSDAMLRYNIPPGRLESVLAGFEKASGVRVVYTPELVQARMSQGLNGQYDALEALQVLLKSTGIEVFRDGETWTLRAVPQPKSP